MVTFELLDESETTVICRQKPKDIKGTLLPQGRIEPDYPGRTDQTDRDVEYTHHLYVRVDGEHYSCQLQDILNPPDPTQPRVIQIMSGIEHVNNCREGIWNQNPYLMDMIAEYCDFPLATIAKGLSYAADLPFNFQRMCEIIYCMMKHGMKLILLNPKFTSRKLYPLFATYIMADIRNYTFEEIKIIENKLHHDMLPMIFWTKPFRLIHKDDGVRRMWFEVYQTYNRICTEVVEELINRR